MRRLPLRPRVRICQAMECIRVGLAEPDPAIEEEGVEGCTVSCLGHTARRGIGQLVRFADHEVFKIQPGIERGRQVYRLRRSVVETCISSLVAGGPRFLRHRAAARDVAQVFACRCPFCDRTGGRLHDNFDTLDRVVFIFPDGQNSLRIVAGNPVAHEASRNGQTHISGPESSQRQGF